jgi:hypothetical protein
VVGNDRDSNGRDDDDIDREDLDMSIGALADDVDRFMGVDA